MIRRFSLTLIVAAGLAAADPTISRTPQTVQVDLGNGAALTFRLDGGRLLGLAQAQVGGIELKSPATVQAPVLAQEFGTDPMIWPALRLTEAVVADGAVELRCQLLGGTGPRLQRGLFVFAGDAVAAQQAGLPAALAAQVQAAEADTAAIDAAVLAHADYRTALAEADRLKAEADAATEGKQKKDLGRKAGEARKRLPGVAAKLRPGVVATERSLQECQARIDAARSALNAHALAHHGRIHRDYYRFAMTLQPEALVSLQAWSELGSGPDLKPAGTLTWVVKPETRTIAGWSWNGWRQSYRFALPAERKVNTIRTHGTWELGGSAVGTTVVSLRYRGLGRIEQAFTAGVAGGVQEAFTTTEVLPGAVGGAPVISPAVPKSEAVGDRGFAIQHRVGAWIARPARGAGAGFVDYQFRGNAAFAAFPLRQGDLRALTECYPGDRLVSQTDEEWFANTSAHETIPMVYLAQVAQEPQPAHVWRTRWHEIDQHVRDAVSAELRFVQPTALPGIGVLASAGTAGYYQGLVKGKAIDGWHGMGVRLVASHSPGWLRGSSSKEAKQVAGVPTELKSGGECSIFDFAPDQDIAQAWKDLSRDCARSGVAYFPWIGMTVVDGGPLTRRVGPEREKWSLNTPDDRYGPGYEPLHVKGNIHHPAFRADYLGLIAAVARDYGLQGFWIDSFQNLFMSQLAWGDGSGAPMQRAYWEIIAQWSRDGIALMAESHAFPGLSCSIEVQEWEKDVSYFRHVWKWHRGTSQKDYQPEELDRLCFRAAAVKGWTAPDKSYSGDTAFSIPSFKRIAHEYLAALPLMARPYLLPEDAGVLWLSADSDGKGVLFSFRGQPLPAGVTAAGMVDAQPVTTAAHNATYAVAAKDLRAAFSVAAPPQPDERLGRTDAVKPFPYVFPAWAK